MENVTAMTAAAEPKHKWLAKGSKFTKKAIMFATVAGIMAVTLAVPAFAAETPPKAATGVVDTSSFITTACTVLKSVICLIGGGVSLWGVVNLLEGLRKR